MAVRTQDRIEPVVVAGMPRAGTTQLFHQLEKHPAAHLPFRKETFFFDFQHGRGENWYQSLFGKMREGQTAFDISPSYFLEPATVERIKAYNLGTKVILVIRDPVEWVISYYQVLKPWDRQMPSFEEFLRGYRYKWGIHSTPVGFEGGSVAARIEYFREAFGSNLMLADFALVKDDLAALLESIESFCGLPPHFGQAGVESVRINSQHRKALTWINRVASHPWVFSRLLYGIYPELLPFFPEKLVKGLRNRLDRYRARGARQLSPEQEQTKRDYRNLVGDRFREDQEYIDTLFARGPVVRGDDGASGPEATNGPTGAGGRPAGPGEWRKSGSRGC